MESALTNEIGKAIVSGYQTGIRHLKELLYPAKCLKCGIYIKPEHGLPESVEACFCDHCLLAGGVYHIQIPYCSKCGIQFPKTHQDSHVCGTCIKTPLVLEKIRAAVEYKGVVKDAIPLFKYHSKLSLLKGFEQLMFQTFLNHFEKDRIDLIIPVPLHRAKLKQRGFNQAFMLIRNFKKQYRQHFGCLPAWDIDIHSIGRKKNTASQTGFDLDQRKHNLKNAFFIAGPEKIEGRSILLIDDVLTTGATCNEAAGLLLKTGARKVQALVLARA
ncbi:MAG: ComF family protein [Pseudomonadota bacterium]